MRRRRSELVVVILIAVLAALALFWPESRASLPGTSGDRTQTTQGGALSAPARVVTPAAPAEVSRDAADEQLQVLVAASKSGAPVEGALVSTGRFTQALVATDESGSAFIRRSGRDLELSVVAEGFVPYVVTLPGDVTIHTVALESGASVNGRVESDLGEAVVGARVWCVPSENASCWPHPTGLAGTTSAGGIATTQDDGRFHISGLADDVDYEVFWAKSGWVRYPPGRPYPVRASALEPVVLKMSPQARVRIHLVDERTGERVTTQDVLTMAGPGVDVGREPLPWCEAEDVHNLLGENSEGDHFYVRVGDTGTGSARTGSVEVEATALGYAPLKKKVEFEFGTRQTVRLAMTPRREADFGSLRLNASLAGQPYTGRLVLKLRSEDRNEGTWGSAVFDAGKQSQPITLPVGRYELSVRPAGIRGHFMTYTAPVEVRVDRASLSEHRIAIAASALTLEVIDQEGRPVVGYDLGVTFNGKSLGLLHNWDLLCMARAGAERGGVALPVLWCSPGESLKVAVNKYGVGYYFGLVPLATQPGSSQVRIILDQPARDFRAAWRSD